MTNIASYMYKKNYILRSGHADGADIAFENGSNNLCEIWVPWKYFNGSSSTLTPSRKAFAIAKKFHPAWDKCSDGAKRLHARNVHQILGVDLQTPSKYIICWTKDGKFSGGTGQALRIGSTLKIPIYNLHDSKVRESFERLINE